MLARRLPLLRGLLLTAAVVLAGMPARAADAGHGKQLALAHCAACHNVGEHPRNEVAQSPSFAVIARKYAFKPDAIAHAIAGPHPKMNFAPNGAQAADIAAYIATLGK
jgi:mono/diheme cytochrome c family protein